MGAGVLGAYRWQWLRAGLAARLVQDTILGVASSAVAFDAGAQADFLGATVGVAVRNAGNELQPADSKLGLARTVLPTEVRIGLAYRYVPLRLGGGVEAMTTPDRDMKLGVGVEYWPAAFLALRGGMTPGTSGAITAGFTALWRTFGLDYGFATAEAGINHRIALSYAMGAAPAARETSESAAEEAPAAPVAAAASGPAPARGAKQLNLAVADLRAENVSAGNSAVIADLLRGELVKTHAFNVIEKANMDKVLAEQAFQQTGCSSEECAVKLGKLLNVQRMVVGSFGQLLDSYFLNVRVVDVETGRVVFGDSAEGKTVADLKVGVRDLAKRMASQIR
jgi:hypothetical protein